MATIVLTGATSGIGRAAARLLARSPHFLWLHGPQPHAIVQADLEALQRDAAPDTRLDYVQADFADPDGPRRVADRVLETSRSVDVLVNNAAIPGPPRLRTGTFGTELAYQVNFLAGASLLDHLLPAIPTGGRVVNVASATHFSADLDLDDLDFHKRSYSPSAAYAQSKLAIVAYSNWLAAHIPQRVISLHPGVVNTPLLHAMFAVHGTDVGTGGAHMAAAVSADVPTGTYLHETTPAPPAAPSLDPDLQQRLVSDTRARLSSTPSTPDAGAHP